MSKLLDVRKYSLPDQQRFAELSGDFNPLHLDPISARREFFGAVVVHGVHGVVCALDAYLARLRQGGTRAIALQKLTAQFTGPIYLYQRVETHLVEEQTGWAKLQTRNSEQILIEVEIWWSEFPHSRPDNLPTFSPSEWRLTPLEFSLRELSARRGKLGLYLAPELAATEFPNLVALASFRVLAEILAMTRLVGMECPGLRSIFKSLAVDFQPHTGAGNALIYEVTHIDSRFSLVKIALQSGSLSGAVEAFFRPAPQQQPEMAAVQKLISAGEFAAQRALIIGGSRGLGEVAAKIVAAGSGQVAITYHQGAADAQRVASEIRAAGGVCQTLPCDVARPQPALAKLAKFGCAPSHIYYFASPKISINKSGAYNPKLFRAFASFYADGFFKTYQACRSFWPGDLFFFYPSTVILGEQVKGLAEYAAAKAAGEALCAYLSHFDRKLSILVRRLPRLATDQTTTYLPHPAANPLEVIIEVVKDLNKLACTPSG